VHPVISAGHGQPVGGQIPAAGGQGPAADQFETEQRHAHAAEKERDQLQTSLDTEQRRAHAAEKERDQLQTSFETEQRRAHATEKGPSSLTALSPNWTAVTVTVV
jgi:hypothetical protein